MVRINTLEQLMALAIKRKAVIVPNHGGYSKPKPASWMIGLQARYLYNLFKIGMYVYEKEKR